MTEELFQQWFDSIFLRCCSATRPLILVLDNREAFYNDNLQAMAAQKQVRACVRASLCSEQMLFPAAWC